MPKIFGFVESRQGRKKILSSRIAGLGRGKLRTVRGLKRWAILRQSEDSLGFPLLMAISSGRERGGAAVILLLLIGAPRSYAPFAEKEISLCFISFGTSLLA